MEEKYYEIGRKKDKAKIVVVIKDGKLEKLFGETGLLEFGCSIHENGSLCVGKDSYYKELNSQEADESWKKYKESKLTAAQWME